MKKKLIFLLLAAMTMTSCAEPAYLEEKAEQLQSELSSLAQDYLSDLSRLEYAIDNLNLASLTYDQDDLSKDAIEIEIKDDDENRYALHHKEFYDDKTVTMTQGEMYVRANLLTSFLSPLINLTYYSDEQNQMYVHFIDTSILEIASLLLETYLGASVTYPENGKVHIDLSRLTNDNNLPSFGVRTIFNIIDLMPTPYSYEIAEKTILQFSLSKRFLAIMSAEIELEAEGKTYKDESQTAFNNRVDTIYENLKDTNLNYFYLDFYYDKNGIEKFYVSIDLSQNITNDNGNYETDMSVDFDTIILNKNEDVTIDIPADLNDYGEISVNL